MSGKAILFGFQKEPNYLDIADFEPFEGVACSVEFAFVNINQYVSCIITKRIQNKSIMTQTTNIYWQVRKNTGVAKNVQSK